MPANKILKKAIRNIKKKDLTDSRRSERINLRVAPRDKKQLEEGADSCGLTLSEFLIQAGLFAAIRIDKEVKK